MNSGPLSNLTIRTAIVRTKGIGYIYACDLEKERDDIPHTVTFKWDRGNFVRGDCNYNAHTVCITAKPLLSLVNLSEAGMYSIVSSKGSYSGNILDDSHPSSNKPRFGGFRALAEIEGEAYAVGFGGMVYRLDGIKSWTRMDEGLPDTFDIEAVHGFSSSDIYAVGHNGEAWHFDGSNWSECHLPTNANLTNIKCTSIGKVYITGHDGILLQGSNNLWEIIDHQNTDHDIWDIEWFDGHLYVSTLHAVYKLNGHNLEEVDFGEDKPSSCYQLSSAEGVMWSNGEYDIMSFDGVTWTRVA